MIIRAGRKATVLPKLQEFQSKAADSKVLLDVEKGIKQKASNQVIFLLRVVTSMATRSQQALLALLSPTSSLKYLENRKLKKIYLDYPLLILSLSSLIEAISPQLCPLMAICSTSIKSRQSSAVNQSANINEVLKKISFSSVMLASGRGSQFWAKAESTLALSSSSCQWDLVLQCTRGSEVLFLSFYLPCSFIILVLSCGVNTSPFPCFNFAKNWMKRHRQQSANSSQLPLCWGILGAYLSYFTAYSLSCYSEELE